MLFRSLKIVFATLIIIGCKNDKPKDKAILSREREFIVSHGRIDAGLVGREVELEPNQFANFISLMGRVDEITCNDSIPIIKVYKDTITHIFNINLNCWNDGIIYDYSQKNVLIIHNDSIEKRLTNPWVNSKYRLDDLEVILKKDLTNNGSDPNWSVSPAKLILHISVSENRLELLPVIFGKLADATEHQTLDMEFGIWITDYIPHFIPPEPPPRPNND